MDFTDFFATLREPNPPIRLSPALQALWHDAHGDWERAHALVNDATDADSAWVHAYLHRKEGDQSNASYWYQHAQRPVFSGRFDQEWREIVTTLLRVIDHRGGRTRKKEAEGWDDED